MRIVSTSPLPDAELALLEDVLGRQSPFGLEALVGFLHAVAIGPSGRHPSAWIHDVFPSGTGKDMAEAQAIIGSVMRLYNEVVRGIADGALLMPDATRPAECDTFASGYLAGADRDPSWMRDPGRRELGGWAAYLGGRMADVPRLLPDSHRDDPELTRHIVYSSMADFIVTADEAFAPVRAASIARNAPCPCGSRKKYKRCCLSTGTTVRGARGLNG